MRKLSRTSTIVSADEEDETTSMQDLRNVLASTQSNFPNPNHQINRPLPEQFEDEEQMDTIDDTMSPQRRLSRCLTHLPGRPVTVPNKRFSFQRRHTTSCDPVDTNNFTKAWLRTTDFRKAEKEEEPSIEDMEELRSSRQPRAAEEEDNVRNSRRVRYRDEDIDDDVDETKDGSIFSLDSNNDAIEEKEANSAEEMWIHNKQAKASMLTALTGFYCLFMTIFALVLELSHLLSGEESREIYSKDLIFGLYMYGVSIIFFIYMYVVLLLNPRWYTTVGHVKRLFRCFSKKSSDSSDSLSSAAATIRKVTHNSPSAGSLFLRLGCVVFGVIGVVYYAFMVFLCSSDPDCSNLSASLDICAVIFIFTQMHFIFCNWKLSITGSHLVARIGTMHLIAANLWTWIRYILMEEGVMEKEIREVFNKINRSTIESLEEDMMGEADHNKGGCQAAECILGSLSEVMFTSIVEYSLIAAAVMFIVWRNIGRVNHGSAYVKRKHQIRVDCSKTTTGLFLGLAFLAATFTSMVIYYGYSILGKSKQAAFVYAFTDIFQYVCSTVGCLIAIYQMRALRYLNKKHSSHAPREQELLDQILLSVGLIGELIYSVAGLVGLTGDSHWETLTFILLFVHIFRLVQVGVQTFLLYLAARVRVGASDRESQPGKQAITFLLAANLAIFLMNLFESEKPGVSEIIVDFYGKRSWVFLVRSFSPLTIFYRFHSSVILAEIWKNVYAQKDVIPHGGVA